MKNKIKALIGAIVVIIIAGACGLVVNINLNGQNGDTNVNVIVPNAVVEYSDQEVPAMLEGDQGEVIETTEFEGEEIKTVEEVDGGVFEDATTGVSVTEGEYDDLGWAEWYNTSSPEAFRNDTIGKCIYANNKFGAQCVSLSRVFWWSYANRDVSTCGTGMAKGMMNCWEQNAGADFDVYWKQDVAGIQAGDWLVFDGGQYGHVGMALGGVNNGYVALLGENQGGRACDGGGAATNIINISVKNLIGYYRPKAYIKPEPAPEPEPEPVVDVCKVWEVKKGDTLGKIMKTCKGKIEWGKAMEEYASHWYSIKFKKTVTVLDGWNNYPGVGLFAGDTIEYRSGE